MTIHEGLRESRFTAARPECPRPDYWTSADSESAEREVSAFIGALVRVLQPELVIETGTGYGQTTGAIIDALRANGHGHVATFETDPLRAAAFSQEMTRLGLDSICEAWATTVQNGTPLGISSEGVRTGRTLAFFDSDPQQRADEFMHLLAAKILASGDIVVFHDAGPQHIVRDVIEQLAKLEWLRIVYFPTPRGLLIGEVL